MRQNIAQNYIAMTVVVKYRFGLQSVTEQGLQPLLCENIEMEVAPLKKV